MIIGGVSLLIFMTPWLVNAVVRPRVEAALSQRLNVPVTFEYLAYSWFTGCDLRGIRVANPASTPAGAVFTISRIRGDIRWFKLVTGEIVFGQDLVIDSPHLCVQRLADGSTTLQRFLGDLVLSPADAAASELLPLDAPVSLPPVVPIIRGTVRVNDFVAVFIDSQQQRMITPSLAMVVTVDTVERPVQVQISTAAGDFALKASMLLGQEGRFAPEKMSGTLDYQVAPEFSIRMRPWLALVPHLTESDPVVSGTGHLEFSSPTSVQGQGTLSFKMDHGVLTLPGAAGAPPARYVVSPGAVEMVFTGTAPVQGTSQTSGALTASWATLAVEAQAQPVTIFQQTTGQQITGQQTTVVLRTRLDVGEMARRFPGLIGDPRLGALLGIFEGAVQGTVTTTATGTAGVATVSVAGSGLSERQLNGAVEPVLDAPHIAAELHFDTTTGHYALARGVVQVTGVQVTLDGAVTLDQPVAASKQTVAGSKEKVPVGMAQFLATLKNLSLQATCHADLSVLTAAVRRVLPTLGSHLAAAGVLRGEVSVIGETARPEVFALRGKVSAEHLKIDGISTFPKLDLAPLVSASLVGELDVAAGHLTLSEAFVTSPLGTCVASGTALSGVHSAAPQLDLMLMVTAQPEPLAQLLAARLAGTMVRGEPVTLQLAGTLSAVGGLVQTTLKVPRVDLTQPSVPGPSPTIQRSLEQSSLSLVLRGAQAWSELQISQVEGVAKVRDGAAPAALDIVTVQADTVTIERFKNRYSLAAMKLTAPGLVAEISGGVSLATPVQDSQLAPFSVHGTLDMQRLMAWATRWGVGVPLAVSGVVDFRVLGAGTVGACALQECEVSATKLQLTAGDKTLPWPTEVRLSAELTGAPLALFESPLQIKTLTISAPGAELRCVNSSVVVADLLATLAQVKKPGPQVDPGRNPPLTHLTHLELQAVLSPAKLLAALPAQARPTNLQFAPEASAVGSMTLSGPVRTPTLTLAAELPAWSFTPAHPEKTVEIHLDRATFSGKISCAENVVTVTELSLASDLATSSGNLVVTVAPDGGLAAVQAALRGSADVNRLVMLAQSLGSIPPDTMLRGERLEWSLDAAAITANGDLPFVATMRVPQCLYRDATYALPQQDVHLELLGVLRDLGQTVVIDPASRLTATTIQAKIHGVVRDVRGVVQAENLIVEATYMPQNVSPLLQAMGKGQLSGTTPEVTRLALTGPLRRDPEQPLMAWLAGLNSHDSQLGFGTWSHAGFTVVGPPLPLRLANGTANLTYDCTVNGGPTALQISAVIPTESCDFRLSTSKLRIASDLAWLVGYLNPLFKDEQQGTLAGHATVAIQGTWRGSFTPVDMRQAIGTALAATGNVSASKVSVAGSKIVVAILNGVSGGSAADLAEIAPTDFVISRGVLSYRDMQVRIGGITLSCSGTVNVVTDAIDMAIVAPFANSLQATKVGKYLPKTLTLQIRGTLTKPIYDFNAAVKTALKEALEKAGKEELAGQVGGLLDGLLKKKKDPPKK